MMVRDSVPLPEGVGGGVMVGVSVLVTDTVTVLLRPTVGERVAVLEAVAVVEWLRMAVADVVYECDAVCAVVAEAVQSPDTEGVGGGVTVTLAVLDGLAEALALKEVDGVGGGVTVTVSVADTLVVAVAMQVMLAVLETEGVGVGGGVIVSVSVAVLVTDAVAPNVSDVVAMCVRVIGFVTVPDGDWVVRVMVAPLGVRSKVGVGVGTFVMVVSVMLYSAEPDGVTVTESVTVADGVPVPEAVLVIVSVGVPVTEVVEVCVTEPV